MMTCPECGHLNYTGALFCGECGASLLELGGEVAVLETPREPTPPSLVGQHIGEVEQVNEIVFMIPISGRHVKLPVQPEIYIGRSVPGQGSPPDLDLTPDDGAEYGVSRNHAVLKASSDQGVVLIDLDSTNGTKLNNYRLPPDLPYPVKSGDEVQFGSLLVHVFLR